MMIKKLTAEDIRYAKPITLQRLTGIPAPSFFHWSAHRSLTDPSANKIAAKLGLSVEEVRRGFALRRADYFAAKEVELRLEEFAA